jgi:hypothetical protein
MDGFRMEAVHFANMSGMIRVPDIIQEIIENHMMISFLQMLLSIL